MFFKFNEANNENKFQEIKPRNQIIEMPESEKFKDEFSNRLERKSGEEHRLSKLFSHLKDLVSQKSTETVEKNDDEKEDTVSCKDARADFVKSLRPESFSNDTEKKADKPDESDEGDWREREIGDEIKSQVKDSSKLRDYDLDER